TSAARRAAVVVFPPARTPLTMTAENVSSRWARAASARRARYSGGWTASPTVPQRTKSARLAVPNEHTTASYVSTARPLPVHPLRGRGGQPVLPTGVVAL